MQMPERPQRDFFIPDAMLRRVSDGDINSVIVGLVYEVAHLAGEVRNLRDVITSKDGVTERLQYVELTAGSRGDNGNKQRLRVISEQLGEIEAEVEMTAAALEQKVGSIETRLVKVVEVLEDNNRKWNRVLNWALPILGTMLLTSAVRFFGWAIQSYVEDNPTGTTGPIVRDVETT